MTVVNHKTSATIGVGVYWALPGALFLLMFTSLPFLRFLVNEPGALGKESALYLLQHCRDIGFVLVLFFGFYSVGKRILQFFKFKEGKFNQLEKFLYSSLLGEAAVGYLLLVLGLSGLFQKKSFALLYLLLVVCALPEIKKIALLLSFLRNLLIQKCSLSSFLLALFLSMALLRGFIASGAPPVDWDSLAYHLAFPKLFLEQEKIFRISWSINGHYPLHTEMIYTLALSLCSDLAAHWVNFIHGILFLLAVFSLAQRFFSDFAAKSAVTILAAQPVFQRVFGNAATDLPVAFICTMAFHAWLSGKDEKKFALPHSQEVRFLFLCGTLCGIAASYKLTGLWFSFSIFLLSLFILIRSASPIQWKGLFYFTFAFGLLAFPWYLKNIFWTGNPLWPYLGEWFGANPDDIDAWKRMRDSLTEGVDKKVMNWLLLPVKIIFNPELFRHQPHYFAISFLSLLVLKIFQKEKTKPLEFQMLFFIFIFGSIWFWSHQEWRYMLPVVGMGVILISFWLEQWMVSGRIGKFVILFFVFLLLPVKDLTINNELFVFFGLKSKRSPTLSARERYLGLVLGDSYRLMKISNQLLPENAKVLFFGEVRGYYFNHPYVWGDPLNPGVFSYAKLKNAEELYRILRDQQFTHIFYNPLIGNYKGDQTYYTRANQWMRDVIKNHARLVANSGPVALFQISTKSKVP